MSSKQTAAKAEARDPAPPRRPPAPIKGDRVINLFQATGEPQQVVLENDRDPVEVLGDVTYWQGLPSHQFPVGCKFELTNDAGTFLYEVWIRRMFGSLSTGVRDINFHYRVVWDERADAVIQPIIATGRWEIRHDGRHFKWRVYSPSGAVTGPSFNDEGAATAYRAQQEGNPR